jgi:hypothetical protein
VRIPQDVGMTGIDRACRSHWLGHPMYRSGRPVMGVAVAYRRSLLGSPDSITALGLFSARDGTIDTADPP